MRASRALSLAAVLFFVAGGLYWPTIRRGAAAVLLPAAERSSTGEVAVMETVPVAPGTGSRLPIAKRTAGGETPGPAPSVDSVRVRGTVRRHGRPAEDWDLSFHGWTAPLEDEEDWDFTDEHGRYEVRLAPGTYVVSNRETAWWSTELVVPAHVRELVFDIDL